MPLQSSIIVHPCFPPYIDHVASVVYGERHVSDERPVLVHAVQQSRLVVRQGQSGTFHAEVAIVNNSFL